MRIKGWVREKVLCNLFMAGSDFKYRSERIVALKGGHEHARGKMK
jgi:hypothetical protein